MSKSDNHSLPPTGSQRGDQTETRASNRGDALLNKRVTLVNQVNSMTQPQSLTPPSSIKVWLLCSDSSQFYICR